VATLPVASDESFSEADLAHSQEENDAEKKVGAIAIKSFALLVVLAMACRAMAQDAGTTYTKMASVNQYLMPDQGAEIALARSAAPESISRYAEVLILGVMVLKQRSKAKTVSCVSWGVRGRPSLILTFGIRRYGSSSV
jgi:hypothetical protein